MPYTADKPSRAPSSQVLRETIPGWGVDLDPHDRPSVPKERFDPTLSGAHWVFPDRQPELTPRERSIEHAFITPVFGTSAPLKGLSGVIRRYAYRYSEGRAAHWLMLLGADRVDAVESHVLSFFTTRPDNPITETGVLGEPAMHPIRSRFGRARSDRSHLWMDPLIVAVPWVLAGGLLIMGVRAVTKLAAR